MEEQGQIKVQICQIFGFSPETINKIVTNKKKGIF